MSNYLKRDRLEDVIRFVQFAGLRPTFQSTDSLTTDFLGKPRSAENWYTVASEHPELFRVAGAAANPLERPLSILARYFLTDDADGREVRRVLEFDEVNQLLELILKIHERQIRDQERRKAVYAIIGAVAAALVAGFFALVTKR